MIPIYYSQDMSIPKWRRIESRGETREYFDKHQSEYPVQKRMLPNTELIALLIKISGILALSI